MVRMPIVMSGLPGTGKSSIADALGHELGAPVLSVDRIEGAARLADGSAGRAAVRPGRPA